jgi:hypothetical protein
MSDGVDSTAGRFVHNVRAAAQTPGEAAVEFGQVLADYVRSVTLVVSPRGRLSKLQKKPGRGVLRV